MAAAAFLIAGKSKKTLRTVIAALSAELIMTAGYFIYECFVLKYYGAALAAVPMNLIQGAFAVTVSVPVLVSINRSGKLRKMIYNGK